MTDDAIILLTMDEERQIASTDMPDMPDMEEPLLSGDEQEQDDDASSSSLIDMPSTSAAEHHPPSQSAHGHSVRCCGFALDSLRRGPSLQFTAMISNLSTSYNVVNISMALPILQQLHHNQGTSAESKSLLATSLLAGMMAGQLFGGALGDSPYLGRLRALQLVMALQVVASLASSLCGTNSSSSHDDVSSLYMQLASWRFLLGVGAGAVYPLAAVISAENNNAPQGRRTDLDTTNNSTTGTTPTLHETSTSNSDPTEALSRVVLTFSMQGIGFLAVPVAALALLYSLDDLDTIWRLLLALGSLPGVVLLVLHCVSSSPNDQQEGDLSEALEQTADDNAGITYSENAEAIGLNEPLLPQRDGPLSEHHGLFETILSEENLVAKLMGTAATWFLFDVLFYGNTLFQPTVMSAAFGMPDSENGSPFTPLRQTALDSVLLTSMALPGYFVAAWMLGTKSRLRQTPRYVMLQGFACMSVLYFIIGLFWERLKRSPALLIVVYGLTFFFANYGPNTTTFVLPSLIYSAPCRATLNGVSAAAGKLGAFVGAALFAPIADTYGDETVMLTCSVLALVAFAITYQFVRL